MAAQDSPTSHWLGAVVVGRDRHTGYKPLQEVEVGTHLLIDTKRHLQLAERVVRRGLHVLEERMVWVPEK